ncbi:hypothetical protein [Undibacterium sp. SXout20W]|uniref:hypothetical protein n=1 Tax=Undibacterium sp. SXout20W TaxID=3413051 RepID=UPI003BF37BA7
MNLNIFLYAAKKLQHIFLDEKALLISAACFAVWSLNSAYSSIESDQYHPRSKHQESRDLGSCNQTSFNHLPATTQNTSACSSSATQAKQKGLVLTECILLCLLIIQLVLIFTGTEKSSNFFSEIILRPIHF